MSEVTTVKRCPCCGSGNVGFDSKKMRSEETGRRVLHFSVFCFGCGLTTGFHDTFDYAVTVWNRRSD